MGGLKIAGTGKKSNYLSESNRFELLLAKIDL